MITHQLIILIENNRFPHKSEVVRGTILPLYIYLLYLYLQPLTVELLYFFVIMFNGCHSKY